MSIVTDIAKELLAMFIADARLTMAVLFLVGCVAVLVMAFRLAPLPAGALLILGCLGILIDASRRGAKERAHS
jgi:hypothetical protein